MTDIFFCFGNKMENEINDLMFILFMRFSTDAKRARKHKAIY